MIKFQTRIGPGFYTTPTFEGMFFPAGEAHVKVINENEDKGPLTEIARVYGYSADDLMLLAMWADYCVARGSETVVIMPYFPGARQDRGLPFGLGVYASIIETMDLNQLIVFDPHSEALHGRLTENFPDAVTIVDSRRVIRDHVVGRADRDDKAQAYDGIICPDQGAQKRSQAVADVVHLPLFQARKHRDESTGQLSGFTIEELPSEGRFLVVDDICDGGGTFMGLAAASGLPKERLGLYVSHGVFSGKAPQLLDAFGEIFTTNSYPSSRGIATHEINIDPYLYGAIKK